LHDGTAAGGHHDGGSFPKDAHRGLPRYPSWPMGQGELQDQQREKAISIPTRRRLKQQGERFTTSLFIPLRKPKRSFETHARDSCKHLGPGRYVSVINDNH
jgi:hypothetical protein